MGMLHTYMSTIYITYLFFIKEPKKCKLHKSVYKRIGTPHTVNKNQLASTSAANTDPSQVATMNIMKVS